MPFLAAIPAWVGYAAMAGGTLMSMAGQRQAGDAAAQSAANQAAALNYKAALQRSAAKSTEQRAHAARGSKQREAMKQRKIGDFIRSKALAKMGVSGADPSSGDSVRILSGIDDNANFNVWNALYEGEDAFQGLMHRAALQRAGAIGTDFEAGAVYQAGRSAQRLASTQSLATGLKGIGGIAGKYGARAPSTTSDFPAGDSDWGMWDEDADIQYF